MNETAAALVSQADQATVGQDFGTAQILLRKAAEAQPDDASILLRLAGVSRAARDLNGAMDAVHQALAISPLDFTALLLRASLLEQAGDARAGEAWGHAIAQRPEGALPPALNTVLTEGGRHHREWIDRRATLLESAMAAAEAQGDDEERRRIMRFRNNALHRTRPYHSEPTHFFFPELTEREFHPRTHFHWLAEIEAHTDLIAAELEALLASERADLVPYIQYAEHTPMRQWKPLNHNLDWTAIHLLQSGKRVKANAAQCPATMALLDRLDQPVIPGASPSAMFSLLAPGTAIPPHVGYNNARLVCHLPLIVPEGCWFRVGAETRAWHRGEAFVFDDTIEHEAMNSTDHLRIVLIFDVWHPGLSVTERAAVSALIGAAGGNAGGL